MYNVYMHHVLIQNSFSGGGDPMDIMFSLEGGVQGLCSVTFFYRTLILEI